MSVLIKGGGVTTLSALTIDADKDWQAFGISNLEEVALGMAKGDLAVRGNTVLQRLQPSTLGYVLTSAGLLHIPSWQPPPGPLLYYFPAPIDLSHTEAIVVVAHSISEPVGAGHGMATSHAQAYDDAPALLIKQKVPLLVSVNVETVIAAADHSSPNSVPVKSALSILCDGFVEETAAGVQTDHTLQARDAAPNDLNLCPMSGDPLGLLDKIYIGSNYKFWQAQIQVGTNGAGNWTNVAYYWNGAAWTACIDENDGSNSFLQGTGLKFISHTPQAGWALSVIQLMNLYWMMIRTDNFVNQATKPLGNQIWVALGG